MPPEENKQQAHQYLQPAPERQGQESPPDNSTRGNYDALMPELMNRFDHMQETFNKYMQEGNQRLTRLEKIAEARGEKWRDYEADYQEMKDNFKRMESGLLHEFRVAQDIMKAMIEHDMSIEKAKLDFKLELEKKQNEMKLEIEQRENEMKLEIEKRENEAKQEAEKVKNEQEAARKELVRNMWIKIGGVLLPVLTALATAASIMIPKWFE